MDITQEGQMEELLRATHMGRYRTSMPSSGVPLSQHLKVFTDLEALQRLKILTNTIKEKKSLRFKNGQEDGKHLFIGAIIIYLGKQ